MKIFENQKFVRRTFSLDDCVLVKCVFRNCTLLYSGGEFQWQDTVFDNCAFNLVGAAQRTAAFLTQTNWPGQKSKPPAKDDETIIQ